ncbi:unnamed protein product [Ranitomeya imitator]|uniref:2-acylglycerol O-acyltransferase 1 n=1 Tax=Ranitomeya imitator TaxID=111125 RepID=A0ABN9KYA5_9NEOB|nr:unnamed protein product [Ranitomeya imitator]
MKRGSWAVVSPLCASTLGNEPNCSLLSAAQCCVGLFLLLLLARFWLLVALYVLWLYLDWETPQDWRTQVAGGTKLDCMEALQGYFPIKIIKTVDLDPQHNYLMGFHPHGVLVAGAFGNFCTNYTEFKDLFPGLTPYLHILPFWFRCPFFREYIIFFILFLLLNLPPRVLRNRHADAPGEIRQRPLLKMNQRDSLRTPYGPRPPENYEPLIPDFVAESGIKFDTHRLTEIDFFIVFFSEAFVNLMVEQTNLYARQFLEQNPRSSFSNWSPVDAVEMMQFLGPGPSIWGS